MQYLHNEFIEIFDKHIEKNKIRHFYLLTGENGIGKRTVARNMAKKLLCSSEDLVKPCNACLSCKTFDAGTNVDHVLIDSDEKSILISKSRKILEELSYKPINSKRKVVVIADAQKLTPQAQNSILKAFEEPPENVVIIMTCLDENQLLDTIISRAFRYMLKPQKLDLIADIVGNTTPFALNYGNGNIGRTIECMSENFDEKRRNVSKLIEAVIDGDHTSIRDDMYIEDIEKVFELTLIFLRDILLIKSGSVRIINVDMERIIKKIEKKVEYPRLMSLIDGIRRANELIYRNTNKKIIFNDYIFGS